MATRKALAIKANAACDRIEAALAAGGVDITLPRLHKDREMLRVQQLEQIAGAVEQLGSDGTLDDARELVSGSWTKDEMTALLLGNDEESASA